jgi:hypothetical protein
MDIGRDGYWKPHVINSSALSAPKTSKAVTAQKKNVLIDKLMCQLTHLSLIIFPNRTSFDVIFLDSPIFNRRIIHGVLNIIWWKNSISTTYSGIGGIHTTNLSQRIIGQRKCILRFVVNDHPSPYNNNNGKQSEKI